MSDPKERLHPGREPVVLVLWWSEDKAECIREIAERSGKTLDDAVDDMLDDWADSMTEALSLVPEGIQVHIGRWTAEGGLAK